MPRRSANAEFPGYQPEILKPPKKVHLSARNSQVSILAHMNLFFLPSLRSHLQQNSQNLISSEKRKIKSYLLCLNEVDHQEQKHKKTRRRYSITKTTLKNSFAH